MTGGGGSGSTGAEGGAPSPKGREGLSNERLEPSVKTNKFSEETWKPRGTRQRAKDSRPWCIHGATPDTGVLLNTHALKPTLGCTQDQADSAMWHVGYTASQTKSVPRSPPLLSLPLPPSAQNVTSGVGWLLPKGAERMPHLGL